MVVAYPGGIVRELRRCIGTVCASVLQLTIHNPGRAQVTFRRVLSECPFDRAAVCFFTAVIRFFLFGRGKAQIGIENAPLVNIAPNLLNCGARPCLCGSKVGTGPLVNGLLGLLAEIRAGRDNGGDLAANVRRDHRGVAR